MPINVISNIEPYGNNDWYIVEDTLVKGGYQCVNNIAERDSINPLNLKAGMMVYTSEEKQIWQLADDLTTWNPFSGSSIFRVGIFVHEVPIVGDVDYVFTETVYFAKDMYGSKAKARIPPIDDVIVEVLKNEFDIVGEITFSASGSSFTGTPVSFEEGDVLTLRFPPDTGMEHVSITLKGFFEPNED